MTNSIIQEAAVYSVAQVAKKLGISKTHAFKLCNDGVIPCLRLGRRIVVPIAAFNEWLGQGKLDI
jgi:excisionase family DNA binding protein